MAVPVLEKTWSFDVNNVITEIDKPNLCKALLFETKTMLLANGWTVRGSSDSVSAVACGGGSPDLWIDKDDIVFRQLSSQARSWIVLRNAALNFELMFDCYNDTSQYAQGASLWIVFSHIGFTGGTTTARPTAADAVAKEQDYFFGISESSSYLAYRWTIHGMFSSDGHCNRIFYSGKQWSSDYYYPSNMLFIDRVKYPATNWTNPVVLACRSTSTNIYNKNPLYANFVDAAELVSAGNALGTGYHYITCESYMSDAIGQKPLCFPQELYSGETFPMLPCGIVSETANWRGRNGKIFDMWAGSMKNMNGVTYPASGKNFIQIGNFIFPWNGSTPVLW